jgi:hypothetical protein
MPVTKPATDPTVAIELLPLTHVPPAVALLSTVDVPIHVAATPVIEAGVGFTVIE